MRITAAIIFYIMLVASPANSEVSRPDPRMATGLFCNTLEQAQEFMTLWNGQKQSIVKAMKSVNALSGDKVCVRRTVLVVYTNAYESIEYRFDGGLWRIVQVKVLAIKQDGKLNVCAPVTQYSAWPLRQAARGVNV